MRPIEFRGKRFDNGEWVYGYYGQFHNRPRVDEPNSHQIFEPREDAYICGSYIGGLWHIVDPETIGQYSGIKDKNGTKIFEGDIIKVNGESYTEQWKNIGVVEYFKGAFGVSYENGKHFLAFNNMSMYIRGYEVIGNIHDNPELLEKVEKKNAK